ncbi:hypothetical protein BH23CHL4_BH23CHL4_06900 [soil metagenome]
MPIQRDGPLEFRISDVVRLRKPHPCGSFDWQIYRLGADIGIKCLGCQRRVMLARKELERRMKFFVSRPDVETGVGELAATGHANDRDAATDSGTGRRR